MGRDPKSLDRGAVLDAIENIIMASLRLRDRPIILLCILATAAFVAAGGCAQQAPPPTRASPALAPTQLTPDQTSQAKSAALKQQEISQQMIAAHQAGMPAHQAPKLPGTP